MINDDRRGSTPPPSVRALPAGTQVGGAEIFDRIGEDANGIRYRARQLSDGREIALKEYFPADLAVRTEGGRVRARREAEQPAFEMGLGSFAVEARLLAGLDHPALVQVLGVWQQNGTAYIATPRHGGDTLENVLRRRRRAPSERWLLTVFDPLLEALQKLHAARCFHREISVRSIVLQANGRPLLLPVAAARRVIGSLAELPSGADAGSSSLDAGLPTAAADVRALARAMRTAITGEPDMRAPSWAYPLAAVASGRFSGCLLRAVDAAMAAAPEDPVTDLAVWRAALACCRGPSAAPPPAVASPRHAASTPTLAEPARSAEPPRPHRPPNAPTSLPRHGGRTVALAALLTVTAAAAWFLARPERSPDPLPLALQLEPTAAGSPPQEVPLGEVASPASAATPESVASGTAPPHGAGPGRI